jgi:leader peptidase (prepilin peptidase)/N-methyltransferase
VNSLPQILDPLFAVPIFLYGLAMGSFLNVCIYRLATYTPADIWDVPGAMRPGRHYRRAIGGRPVLFYCDEIGEERDGKVLYRGEWRLSVVYPRSACPRCRRPIAWYDNVPVLSWLLLHARCRHCAERISARYAAVELLTALLFLTCYAAFGPTLAALKFAVLCFLLLGLIFTDVEHRLLPDALTFPGIVLGLVFSLFVPLHDVVSRALVPGSLGANWRLASLLDAAAAAAAGALVIWGLGVLWKKLRGIEAMGLGDVKLLALLGAFLGLKMVVLVVLLASVTASVFGLGKVVAVWISRARRRMRRGREPLWAALKAARRQASLVLRMWHLPFGAFLGLAALAAIFAGDRAVHWYLEQFR